MAVSGAAPRATVTMADTDAELAAVLETGSDLLLFNRVLEVGFADSDGTALLRKVKMQHPEQKVMMVSNYPETQRDAEAAGALPGFGKREIGSDQVKQRLAAALQG